MALKRTLLVLVAILCAVLLLAGTAKALIGLHSMGMRTVVALTGGDLPHDINGFTNILLLGQGDSSHDGKDLTDTVIVASVDPTKTKSVVVLSLPRDLYFLSTEKMGKGRLNSLYRDYKGYLRGQGMETPEAAKEAMRELATEIGRALNMDIHGALKVDFEGFVQAVDVLGGIDIDVPEDIVDTEYPDENYGIETFTIARGPQHLDGATALKYARSRHSSSDFSRSARQQQLIVAMAEQAKKEKLHRDVSAISELLGILREHVATTLSMREIIALAGAGAEIDRASVVAMQLSDRNGLYDTVPEPGGLLYAPPRNLFEGASVLLPVSIPEFPVTWKQVRTLSALLFTHRSVYLSKPTVSILNAGAKPGSARSLAAELIRYGWNVDHIANAEALADQETSWVVEGTGSNEPARTLIAGMLQMPLQDGAMLTQTEKRDVTIVLGKDFRYQPLQALIDE
jgi:LCP family protein required for cell wall assembly